MQLACQRCRQSLDFVGLPVHQHEPHLGESYVVLPQPPHVHKVSPMTDLSEGLGRVGPELQATSMHEQLRTVRRLLDLSERANPIECGVPLCDDCAAGVLRQLQRRLEEAHAEKQLLQTAFAELEIGEEDSATDESASDHEAEAQRNEESELRAALITSQREREALRSELHRLQQRREEHDRMQESRFESLNSAELGRQHRQEEAMRAVQLVAYFERELQRLEQIQVLDDLFEICCDGPLGTINTLRLGRLPGVSVEWTEINAAIGQVVLLLCTVARLHKLEFSRFVLVPLGSFSKVYRVEDPKTTYELHGSGVAQLGRFFGGGRFDRGLTMMLACAKELLVFASRRPRAGMSAHPPHAIEDDLVGGCSVRLQFNQEEKWTRSFKALLANLKWLVSWHGAN